MNKQPREGARRGSGEPPYFFPRGISTDFASIFAFAWAPSAKTSNSNPVLLQLITHLGVAYWIGGDPNRSIPELETAVRLRPRDPEYHYRLGAGYNGVSHYQEAVRELGEALARTKLAEEEPDVEIGRGGQDI